MRWAVVGLVGSLWVTATLYRHGWFDMIKVWSFPWRTMPYVNIDWALLPAPFSVFCTMAALWCIGGLMVMANRIGRDA